MNNIQGPSTNINGTSATGTTESSTPMHDTTSAASAPSSSVPLPLPPPGQNSTMSFSSIISASAIGGSRSIASLVKMLGKDDPLVKKLVEAAVSSNSSITPPQNLSDWASIHKSEMNNILVSSRQVFCMLTQKKDNINNLDVALDDIGRTLECTHFQSIEYKAACDTAEALIRFLHTFKGEKSRDEALQSEEFRSLPLLVQQWLKQLWFGKKFDFDPAVHFALPRVEGSGCIIGDGKVSSIIDNAGNLQLVNNVVENMNASSVTVVASVSVVAAPANAMPILVQSQQKNATSSHTALPVLASMSTQKRAKKKKNNPPKVSVDVSLSQRKRQHANFYKDKYDDDGFGSGSEDEKKSTTKRSRKSKYDSDIEFSDHSEGSDY